MSSKNRLIGWKRDDPHWRAKFCESVRELVAEVSILEENLQKIHTPWTLCDQILDRLNGAVRIKGCERIAVLFNLEFVHCLIERGINPRRIWFFADASLKGERAKEWYGVNVLDVSYDGTKKNGERIEIMPKLKKQFDVVIMNPPYQPPTKKTGGGSGSRNTLWDKFVISAIEQWVKEDGYLAAIHPSKWRKPLSELFPVISGKNLIHLEMFEEKDGIRVFGASTPFDWYVLQNSPANGKTVVRNVKGEVRKVDLKKFAFLPNCDLSAVEKLLAGINDAKCEVLYSRSYHASDKAWMNEVKTTEFKHPCVHATPKGEPVRYWHSSRKGGFFGIPKIIFGEARSIQKCIVDVKGELGITQQAIGIRIKSKREGEQIKKAIESEAFDKLLQRAMRWSQFRIDWRLFTLFRADFWKDFV